MLAARALFAFYHPGQDPSDTELLGALLLAEQRAMSIQFAQNFGKWCEAWVKSKKGRPGANRRGRRR